MEAENVSHALPVCHMDRRQETQDWFMNSPDDSSPVVVGTIAFGMGLDKKNVRRVFHFNLPRSPEDLAQQARDRQAR